MLNRLNLGHAMSDAAQRPSSLVLGVRIDASGWDDVVAQLVSWGAQRASRYICICNVHSLVTAVRDPAFMQAVNRADMATPDGMPVAWMLRALGHQGQQRINGPDLMWRYLAEAEKLGQVVSFYGSTEDTIALLREAMLSAYPKLRIGVMISPPFRPLSDDESSAYARQINEANTSVMFVGMGCPKQEIWMSSRRGTISAAMVGVGAAFDYHAGTVKRAPIWMQRSGLEWLYRLVTEPRRLWRRYLVTNTIFGIMAFKQLLAVRREPLKEEAESSNAGR